VQKKKSLRKGSEEERVGGVKVDAVIYARFSSDNQRDESITAQVRACTEYAKKHGYNVVRVYTDEAKSARTDDRPGFQRMIEDIRSGKVKVDVVLVHKLDRFARNRYDSVIYRKILSQAGAKLLAVDQPIGDGPESVLLESLLEALAEYYSQNLAKEVMKGMKENAYQGKFNGGWVPLGYDVVDGRYVINEKEAEIVRLIFSMFAEGYSYKKIQEELNARGYKTKRGNPFGKNSLYEILRNPKYAGYYVFNRAPRRLDGKRNWRRKKKPEEVIVVPGAVPAIVSEELFQKVQKMLDARKRVSPRQRSDVLYILTGKVFCGKCGAAMVGNSRRRKAGDKPTRYYECNRRLRTRECDNKRVNKEFLENYVLSKIEENVLSPDNLPELAKRIVALARERDKESIRREKEVRKELDEVNRKIDNIVKAVEDGSLDYDILSSRLKELKARREELEACLADLSSPTQEITEEMVLKYLSTLQGTAFDSMDDFAKKKFVDLYVHEVVVSEDKIEVVLKFCLGVDKNGVGGATLLYPLP